MSRTEVSALHLLHRAGQCADDLFSKNIGKSDLTPRQFAVLKAVSKSEDVSQTALVDATGIDRSTLADIVRRLVERNLLQRRRTRQDARMYAVRLTAGGKSALNNAEPAVLTTDKRLLGALPVAQRNDFISALGRIVETLSIEEPEEPKAAPAKAPRAAKRKS